MTLERKNVMLIDNSIKDKDILISALNKDTLYILYNYDTTSNNILDKIKSEFKLIHIDRLAICNHEGVYNFLNNKPFFEMVYDDLINDMSTNDVPNYVPNVSILPNINIIFILQLIQEFNIKNIDFLSCNSLNYYEWSDYYLYLNNNTSSQVCIGASNDYTGTIKYGGNWILESSGENIENIYFTSHINYYKYLLTTYEYIDDIKYELDGNGDQYHVAGYNVSISDTPVILNNINGIPVTTIINYSR